MFTLLPMSQGQHAQNNVANKLRSARLRFGYPLKWVATLLRYRSTSTISEYEHGHKLPKAFSAAFKLELMYETPLSQLFPVHYAEAARELEEARKRCFPIRRHDEELREERARHLGVGPHGGAPGKLSQAAAPSPTCHRLTLHGSSQSPPAPSAWVLPSSKERSLSGSA